MTFIVDRFHQVDKQIRDLAAKAKTLGIRESYFDALRKMMDRLENSPLEWGDPEYHTKQPGGLVCHGISDPLFVRFVVYEEQKVVMIINITPLATSTLSNS